MKAATIVKHLRETLPRYTNLFGDTVSIASLVNNSGVVTATTTDPHELSNNDYIYVKGALTQITITDITRNGDVATAHTASDHDFTDNFQQTVNIIGAEQAGYNGEHDFIHQANRLTFTFKVDSSTITPATGSPKLIKNLKGGYNGYHQITVADEYTFTYQITSNPESPALGDILFTKGVRISSSVSLARAIQSYTDQTTSTNDKRLWMFVVLGNTNPSRDRYTMTDRTGLTIKGQDIRTTIIEPFSLYIFTPTINEIAASNSRDLMSDLYVYIIKSMLGLYIPSGFVDSTPFGISTLGHGYIEYDYAYYIHEFKFEYSYTITYEDSLDTDTSVAFRDIELQFLNKFNEITMDTKIDLDDEPLPLN